MAAQQRLQLRGISASPGIGVGPAVVLNPSHQRIRRHRIGGDEISREITRLRDAIERSRRELEDIRTRLGDEAPADYRLILDAHLMMHRDELLIDSATETVYEERINAEWAVERAVGTIANHLAQAPVDYFRDRAVDVEHVGKRIIAQLVGRASSLPELLQESVLVAEDLHPADAAQLIQTPVAALVTGLGSATSHTAILARTLEIPAVVGVTRITDRVGTGDMLVVDAFHGHVVLQPDAEECDEARLRGRRYRSFTRQLRERAGDRTETADGVHVELMVNVDLPTEAAIAVENEAEGIGLYRTEFLFMNRKTPPSEDEQYRVYSEIARVTAPNPVTLRTVDMGGDNLTSDQVRPAVPNPALGLRAIRLALARPELMRAQLSAILRAATLGNLRVMFPLIASVDELRRAKRALELACSELDDRGVAQGKLHVGVMIELPSAVMMADRIAQECDFLSVGTNDLVQYTLAVDRANPDVAYLASALDPAVLRMLDSTIKAASNAQRPVSMCGDMAADPFVLPAVIGLGFRCLSVPLSALPLVREVVRRVDTTTARATAIKALGCATAADVVKIVRDAFREVLGDLWEEAGVEV